MVLSVILPVRNGASFIGEAVHSILVQTWDRFEFIVVDNKSTDDTVRIVEHFRDPRIRIIKECRRLGGPTAFNTGLYAAQGRYVARMDADDVACRERIQRQLEYLETHSDIGMVGGQAFRIDEHGMNIGRFRVPIAPIVIRQSSKHVYPLIHPTVMGRRNVWARLGGYREFSPGADYDLLLRALDMNVRVANMPDVLLKYRVRPDSVSHVNHQRTMIASLAVKKMQRMRHKRQFSRELEMVQHLRDVNLGQDAWFKTVDSWIHLLSSLRLARVAGLRPGVVGVLHPVMLRTLWAKYRAERMNTGYYSRWNSDVDWNSCKNG